MKGLKPQALRNLFRSGQAYLQHTNGSCPGHLQTNIVIIPKDVAGEFEQYCRSNSSSCPLIFKSNPGQVTAPLIGDDVDIRLVFHISFIHLFIHSFSHSLNHLFIYSEFFYLEYF